MTVDEQAFEAKVKTWEQVWTVTPSAQTSPRNRFWMRYPSGKDAAAALLARVNEAHEKFELDSNNDALHFRDLGWTIKRIN